MFSYGMNTNILMMQARCPNSIYMGIATLPKYRLTFSSFADVVYDESSEVVGVLWDITDDCLIELDCLEGFPYHYDRDIKEIKVDGKIMEALCYYMTGSPPWMAPSTLYLNMVIDGYNQNGIPLSQLSNTI